VMRWRFSPSTMCPGSMAVRRPVITEVGMGSGE
jgi:hypothetical protein